MSGWTPCSHLTKVTSTSDAVVDDETGSSRYGNVCKVAVFGRDIAIARFAEKLHGTDVLRGDIWSFSAVTLVDVVQQAAVPRRCGGGGPRRAINRHTVFLDT